MSGESAQLDYAPVDPEARAVARSLTLWYVLASTAIFLVAGLLGAALRQSQADIVRLGDNTWYAVMTAHGLGAFVGWAAFAVMGFAWWVLAEVGYPIGRLGATLARAVWWLMVVGVGGVVVTTLVFGFAGSWVFLYPLPFHSAGQWGDWVTAFFAASVLLVGLAIIVWCVAIIVVVTGPGLGSDRRALNRLGAAMGLGILWPKRFVSARPVPYAVIPLTVIAIDMIIATLPLAVLLVEMIIQSFTSSFGRSAAGQERALVVRPPGGLPAALPGGRDLLPAGAALRSAPAGGRQHHRRRLDDRRDRQRDGVGAPPVPGLPERDPGGHQHRDGAADVRAHDRLGAQPLQPLPHDLPLALDLERGQHGALPRPGELAAGRPVGGGQRDDRVGRLRATTRSGSWATSTTWRCSTSAS